MRRALRGAGQTRGRKPGSGMLASPVGGLDLSGPPGPCSGANALGAETFILLVLL